eukprot:4818887-Prymnesium_polylepis.1
MRLGARGIVALAQREVRAVLQHAARIELRVEGGHARRPAIGSQLLLWLCWHGWLRRLRLRRKLLRRTGVCNMLRRRRGGQG